MDPRLALLAVLSTAFADGIPEIKRRVDVERIEPVWGEDELPIVLIDFADEQLEIRAAAPRDYMHTLGIDIVIYCKERAQRLRLICAVEEVMKEWQFILASDVDPDAVAGNDYALIEDIRAGNAINYFKSSDGNEDYLGARLAYEAEFYTRGASDGMERNGVPPRNRLAEFESIMAQWTVKEPASAKAIDVYDIVPDGDKCEP